MTVVFDHAVRIEPESGLALALLLQVREDVHAGGVPPEEERLVGLLGLFEIVECLAVTSSSIVSMRFLPSGPVLSIFWVPSGIGPAVDHTAGLVLFDQCRILEVVLVLELFLGVEVVERAEELVEPMRRRQGLVGVAEVVLAELRGHVALLLEQFGDRHVTCLQSFLRAGQADLEHAGPEPRLAGDETRTAGRAALLAVPVGEQRAFLRDAIDVRRLVAHHAVVVGADVPVADVVSPQDQNIGLLCRHCQSLRYAARARPY